MNSIYQSTINCNVVLRLHFEMQYGLNAVTIYDINAGYLNLNILSYIQYRFNMLMVMCSSINNRGYGLSIFLSNCSFNS